MDEARTLVVAYAFPPFSDASGIVAAKRLRGWGQPFDVIYKDLRGTRSLDGSLTRLVDGLVRRHAQLPGPRTFAGWVGVDHYVRVGMDKALEWEAVQGPYEAVYSRAHFAASHVLAATFKASRPATRWRAEFSDPLSHDVLGGRREVVLVKEGPVIEGLRAAIRARGFREPPVPGVFEWTETAAFALADEILFTNEIQRDFMLGQCDDALAERVRSISVIAPHPTLPREFYSVRGSDYALDPARVNIGYFGNFYSNRSLSVVVDALAGIAESDREQLALHVFTPNPEQARGDLSRPGLQGCVSAAPQVDYLEFLALSDRMDVLLVNDAETPGGRPSPFLPSKWSDYRGSTAAVWGIVEAGSTLSNQDLDHRSPVGSVSGAQQVLVRLARSRPGAREASHPTAGR